MSIQRSGVAGMALPFAFLSAITACSGGSVPAKTPANTAAMQPKPPATPRVSDGPTPPNSAARDTSRPVGEEFRQDDSDVDDAELVVAREVVASCPTLRLVRQHMGEFDPDMIWLAVLESIGDCMKEGGTMERQAIGVSGDEVHRHVVREVLGTRGVAPTRVIAQLPPGAAECQGGANCSKRVDITLIAP
jgi:hypothetical protein